MVLHNQYPWSRSDAALTPVSELRDDDYIVVFHPRDREVALFLTRLKVSHTPKTKRLHRQRSNPSARTSLSPPQRAQGLGGTAPHHGDRRGAWRTGMHERDRSATAPTTGHPCRPRRSAPKPASSSAGTPATASRRSRCAPHGPRSRMQGRCGRRRRGHRLHLHQFSADTVDRFVGLGSARHPADTLLFRPRCRLRRAELRPRRGHAGAPNRRPAGLLVCAEKFSDKIGNVRPSRMIFGDGAAAMVVGPAPGGRYPTSNTSRPTPAVQSAR